ncbi:deoxycytidylate deaminase [Hoeflea prorocentri]|uniref:dCMP deaminase family protein n=1 Tax=Hoeflea prorocentri TaxID=1922333 RepID=A0A9X3ZGQ6_9HYPH|nr:dCMP deaminase family protein [Hoeflea prorocentri]MCY6380143.1 dCMP deaminase family protein [Hoeflea prorocentri]MDA5397943.1 dCMP deaminase family protein [Hoeflea prorocentri]
MKTQKDIRWDKRFRDLANHVASWTEDRDFSVGAVIVGPDREIRATGYNGLPRGVKAEDDERFDRASGEKFFWFEHAERNAIYNAARVGTPVDGCTIYINRFPCSDCARAIIQSGIKSVICPQKPAHDGALDHSFDVSETMLAEAGIAVQTYAED